MKSSFTILNLFGIQIKVHFTFPLLLLYVAAAGWMENGSEGAAFGLVFTLTLFACVVLHELGHSFTARGFGIPVGQILLLPIGGVSSLSKKPKDPLQEILISLAGPLVSVALAFLFYRASGSPELTAKGFAGFSDKMTLTPATLLFWLFRTNLVLAVFNLIPAFPMDGGRVFRAFLRFFLKEPRATVLAASVGKVFAVLFGLVGLLAGNMILALVAFFLYFAGTGEALGEVREEILSHIQAGTVCAHFGANLESTDKLNRVLELVLGSEQRNFPVLEGSNLVGVLEGGTLRERQGALRPDTPVTELMRRDIPRLQAGENLGEALETLRAARTRCCAVFEGSRFLGLLDEDRIRLALSLPSFLIPGPPEGGRV
jgi:Zn-dependent protease